MDSFSSKIEELEKELSVIQKKLKEDVEKSKKLDLEISNLNYRKDMQNCVFNHECRIFGEMRSDLKNIHEAYQKLALPTTLDLQYAILNRKEDLYDEKEKLESQLGLLKLKRGVNEEKLKELKNKATIQKNKKKALILKLKNNIMQSESAKQEAAERLTKLKNGKSTL